MKGYLYSGTWELTPRSKLLLKEILGDTLVKEKTDRYSELHKKLQDKLVELTSKKQKVLQGKYSYLPNVADFTTKLSKVVKKYKLDDWEKLSLCLIRYVEQCHKQDWKYCTLLGYYIEKSGLSQLATDYDNYEEKDTKEVKTEPEDIKDLF